MTIPYINNIIYVTNVNNDGEGLPIENNSINKNYFYGNEIL